MQPQNGSSPKVELLAPAGNFEKLEIVLHYGADAVYLAGKTYSLRNFSGNFTLEQIEKAVELAHAYRSKVYVAVNIYPRNEDLMDLTAYLEKLSRINPDGIIIADPAVLMLARQIMPHVPIHLSTQANTTNWKAASFWRQQGVARINAARELKLSEISDMADKSKLAVEAFVHGAMCISYSGRCLLSNYMAQRPSNQGMCCQPCRFKYALVEETRPGQYFPVEEDDKGTYIFNSKDLCMVEHLPAMIKTGVRSLKIEGRMKGINYAATTVKIYREAIDRYYNDPTGYVVDDYWRTELEKVTSRGYCTGFYLDDSSQNTCHYDAPRLSAHILLGKVLAPAGGNKVFIDVRNQIRKDDAVEIVQPKGPPALDVIRQITDHQGLPLKVAQPGSRVAIQLDTVCRRFDLLRKAPRHST